MTDYEIYKINERNEIAKQLYIHNNNADAPNAVRLANELMSELYGDDWTNKVQPATSKPADETSPADGITIAEHDGEKWVRVKVFDEDFLIAAHDYKEGDKDTFTWEEACKIGTHNKKQWLIIAAFIDQINAKLKEIGGDIIDGKEYWSVQEYNAYYAWCYYGIYGYVYYYTKRYSLTVRPVLALKVNS